MRVLDLGCGPGLYAQRLSSEGAVVTGVDISQRSLDHARKCAEEAGLDIEYKRTDFFDIDYTDKFDVVIQVYGELNVFSDDSRDRLLEIIGRALKKNGIFIFDVTTRELRKKAGLKKGWYVSDSGFWRPGRHFVLEQGYDYPETDLWLDQYIVVDEDGAAVYRNWFHDYNLGTIKAVLTTTKSAPLTFTPNAVAKVKEIMAQQNPVPAGLRVGVVGGGCSGFSYSMAFENTPGMMDKVFEIDGLKVFIDATSSMYLQGATVDYLETLEGAGFKFDNPNVRSTCGCGSSFNV
jgi:iron-sulfur cluster assembly accessory protein